MPMAFLYTPRVYDAYYEYVEGFKSNPWDKIIFYGVSQNSTLFPGNININSDQEWDTLKTMGKCSGFGNSSDPYIIEDLVIDGQGRSRSCILIENSSSNFIIYNSSLKNSAGIGIELISANNSLLSRNYISGNNYGVQIINSNNSFIFNNRFTTNIINALDNGTNNFWNNASIGNYWDDYDGIDVNDDGIGDTPYYIPGSAGTQDNFPIWDDGLDTYIVFYVSGDYSIKDGSIEVDLNIILNITVKYMPYLTNNHISSASVELQSGTFSYSFIEDLTFKQYTLQLDTAGLGVGTHNFVISAQKAPNATTSYKTVLYPIQIIVNEEPESYPIPPLVIDDTGEGDYTWDDAVEQGWCIGSGTEQDPYIIESLEIDGQDTTSCLSIRNSSVYFIIQNCIFFNAGGGINEAGLKLEHVSNAILRNVNCSDNNANGFLLYDCQNITISDSTMNDNDFAGIYLSQSSFNFILNNAETISRNFWGVYLLFSNNNTIGGNFIGYNQFGLFFNNSDFNSILDNIFEKNDQAIYVDEDSEGNHIEGNTIITKGEFPLIIVIVSVAVGIVGIAGLSSAIILRRRVSIPKRGKEVKVYGKKKSKIENKLEERLSFIDHLIKERKIKEAIKDLNEVKDLSNKYSLVDITEACEKSIVYCNNLYLEMISRLKKTVLDLGTKFPRLEIIDISDKSGIEDEDLIISVFQDMISQNEIFGDYFASSKAIAFDQQRNIDQIDELILTYNKWKEINLGKGASRLAREDLGVPEVVAVSKLRPEELKEFNLFLSYSTRDSEYFDMPRIVKRLEDYPDIDRVLFWEADSKQNIVEFMDETLQKCNVFILFCTEHSVKSAAVKDEWQAAFQRRKKELLKLIPVYIKEEHIPPILGHLLNVKFDKEDFDAFIENLHQEIQR